MRYELIKFDHERHDFVKIIKDLFHVDKLEDMNEEHAELFKVGDDSKTSFHKEFYDRYRAGWDEFQNLYEQFIKEEIAPVYSGNFLYQAWPTFRVHLNGNLAVGDFHNDAEFGHPEGEINYIIPLTNSDGTAAPWVESEPKKGDYECMLMRVGYFIIFNGNRLTHGNKVNDTGKTRVSLDFRILPMDCYKENYNGESITRKTKFKIGEYYKLFERK